MRRRRTHIQYLSAASGDHIAAEHVAQRYQCFDIQTDHTQIIRKDRTAEAQFTTQHRLHPVARQTGYLRIDFGVANVRHHRAFETVADQCAVGTHIIEQVRETAVILRQHQV